MRKMQAPENGNAEPETRRPRELPMCVVRSREWYEIFVNPEERHLVNVPTTFQSGLDFCTVMGHNLLAELWHVVFNSVPGKKIPAFGSSDNNGTC
ncbi:hypothetical protein T484DRAFT_1817267 [Baffinella frigidus]|nr:hypothetical protein T484DRAFT_1817267 [Cryptophyta sp. CCMP2293]